MYHCYEVIKMLKKYIINHCIEFHSGSQLYKICIKNQSRNSSVLVEKVAPFLSRHCVYYIASLVFCYIVEHFT